MKARIIALTACCAAVSACAVGPDYKRAPVDAPPAFKEAAGWTPARPADAIDRGAWWSVFGDPVLDDLERQVATSNQTLAQSEAAYRQSRALVAEQRSSLFPTVDLNGSATRSKSTGGSTSGGGRTANDYQVSLGASWAPDLWGKVRRGIEEARANAQASAATVANTRLSAESEVAADYLQLRMADAEKEILQKTAVAYERSLKITQNQFAAGVAAKSDVLQALTQLKDDQASLIDLDRQRTQSEHAIALLIGRPPSELTIAPIADWTPSVPATPSGAPSILLQRRPDIANAERLAAAANAQIGVATAAYFPDLTLSATGGAGSAMLSTLFNSANSGWSLGASAVQTVFNAGYTSATVRAARAAYDQSIATYRQTVLTAFGQVEDDLAAARVLQAEEGPRREAADEASQAEQLVLNEYRAGTVSYTSVVTAQATALSARQSLLTVQVERMTTAVSLIEALGGGWTAPTYK